MVRTGPGSNARGMPWAGHDFGIGRDRHTGCAALCIEACDVVRCVGADAAPHQRSRVDGNWEFDELTVRMLLSIGCVAVASLGGAALYVHRDAAPACDSDRAQGQVYQVLRNQFHLEGVFLHDFTTLSGGFFSDTRDCVAEVAEIRGNVSAADLSWRHIRYRIAHSDSSEHSVVTVDLGGAAAFVQPPTQTMWTRLLAHF